MGSWGFQRWNFTIKIHFSVLNCLLEVWWWSFTLITILHLWRVKHRLDTNCLFVDVVGTLPLYFLSSDIEVMKLFIWEWLRSNILLLLQSLRYLWSWEGLQRLCGWHLTLNWVRQIKLWLSSRGRFCWLVEFMLAESLNVLRLLPWFDCLSK